MAGQSQRAALRAASAWRLAGRQHGVVARRQLVALGFGRHAIEHRIERGRLHPVHRGVYAVGRPDLTREGRWMAAVLFAGKGAALSHASAAALWGVVPERGDRIHVSTTGAHQRRPPRPIRLHRRPGLAADRLTTRDGISVTGIAQTLVDLGTTLGGAALERAVNEADRLDLIDPESLRTALAAHRGEPGVAPLRLMLDRRTFRLTASELERRFLALVRRARLPVPLTREHVNGFEVDFWWPELGLLVETDGLRYHRTAAQQSRDRLRDQTHTAAGLTALRFTHEQVRFDPDHVVGTLQAVGRRIRVG